MDTYILTLVILMGLIFGSFLNVVIYRLPNKVNFLGARSICPNCNNRLKWYHNLPLISYLALRGKCAFCRKTIPIRYPLVELSNALLYLFFFVQYGLTFDFYIYALISSVLIAVFFIDLDHMIIPDSITIGGLVVGLAISFLPDAIGIKAAVIGVLAGGGSLYLIAVLGEFMFKKQAMGGGDIKLAAMLGAFLGWEKMLFIFFTSALIGVIVSVILMIFSSKLRESRMIPFGPFIAAAAVLSISYGNQIIEFYVNNFLMVN